MMTRILLALVIVCVTVQQASATMMFFSEEEDFLAFEPTLVLENFEGATWASSSPARALTGPLGATSTTDFSGGLAPGLTISASPRRSGDLYLGRGGYGGLISTAIGTNHSGARLQMQFEGGVKAASFSLYSWLADGEDQIGVDVYGAEGLIAQHLLGSASAGAPAFLALISSESISSIELFRPGSGYVNAYEVSYGTVPEPASALLLGLGLVGLGCRRQYGRRSRG